MSTLEPRPYFNNAVILDASNCQVENITDEALEALQNVDEIYLHDNLLTTLPRSVTTMNFSFSWLSLHNNPLDCSCDQVWLKDWLTTIRDRLVNSDGIHCETPARLRGRTIWSVNETDFCYQPPVEQLDSRVLISIGSALIVLVICIALFLVALRFRVQAYLKYGYHPFEKDECLGQEMSWDVFIAYAHGDNALARKVMTYLEEHGCRVILHERDFIPGEEVYQNIIEAIHTSKRVLCIVTPHFLDSKYCLQEFSMAQHHNVTIKRRWLIILKHEEFDVGAHEMNGHHETQDEGDQMELAAAPLLPAATAAEFSSSRAVSETSVLRELIKRCTYINLSAKTWKGQLLYAMPVNRLGTAGGEDVPLEVNYN